MKLLAGILLLTWALSPMIKAADEDAPEEKPDLPAIKAKSLELLRDVVPGSKPHSKPMTELETAAGMAKWGTLFSDKETVALVSLDPGPKEYMWDFRSWHLSFLAWSHGRWEYRQYLGSASQFEIHRRKDLGLQIVQGYCQTARYAGKQSSWRYVAKTRTLEPTGVDDWGPYCIKGGYICYKGGTQRLYNDAFTEIYRFAHGKKGVFLAGLGESDRGWFNISFRDRKNSVLKVWTFYTDQNNPSEIKVNARTEDTPVGGGREAVIKLPKGQELNQFYCFELLTGLSSNLILSHYAEFAVEEWTEKVPQPKLLNPPAMKVTGDPEVVQRFQPLNARSKQ